MDASFCIFVIYILFCSGHLGGDIVGGWFFFFSVCHLGGEVDNVLAELEGGRPCDILPSGLGRKKGYVPSNCISLLNSMPGENDKIIF